MRISGANLYSALYSLNGLQGRRSSNFGLGSSLGTVYGGYQNSYKTNTYKLQKEAVGFRSIAEKLQDTDWEKEYKLSRKKSLQNQVCTFVEEFNQLYTQVQNISGSKNGSYGAQLKELVNDNKEKLSEIGICVNKDGSLSVNNTGLKKAKAADFMAVFSGAESLAGKAAVKSIYAEAQAMTITNSYGYGMYGYGSSGYGTYGITGLNGLYGASPYAGSYFDMLL